MVASVGRLPAQGSLKRPSRHPKSNSAPSEHITLHYHHSVFHKVISPSLLEPLSSHSLDVTHRKTGPVTVFLARALEPNLLPTAHSSPQCTPTDLPFYFLHSESLMTFRLYCTVHPYETGVTDAAGHVRQRCQIQYSCTPRVEPVCARGNPLSGVR